MRIGIFGAGKLSNAIQCEIGSRNGVAHAAETEKVEVAWALHRGDKVPDEKIDVVIDASIGYAVSEHIEWALKSGIPMVVAATGWSFNNLAEYVGKRTGILVAPNLSFGIAFAKRMATLMAKYAQLEQGGDISIFEHHHKTKADAPSGTAKSLAETMIQACPRYEGWTSGAYESNKICIVAMRSGSEIGYHEVIYDSPLEKISIIHQARDRKLFAIGAIRACKWICGRKGVYELDDVIRDYIGNAL